MSFDLNFGREDDSSPQLDELRAYFSKRKSFEVSDSQDSGRQFWYHNVATGVYCLVSYDGVIAQIEPYLDDYVTNDGDLTYLPPDKAALVTPLFRNLELTPIDLSAHTSIGADWFS